MSAAFAEHVVSLLEPMGSVEARAMFGGHGLYHGDAIFGIVYEDRVYLKVDDETRPSFEAEGMSPFSPRPDQTIRSYYEVPPEVLEDPSAFVDWARRAVDAQH